MVLTVPLKIPDPLAAGLESEPSIENPPSTLTVVVPGDPQASNLMRLIEWRASAQLRMPHNRKQLSACERGVIRDWIKQGAKDN